MSDARSHQTIVRAAGSARTGTGVSGAYLREVRTMVGRLSLGALAFTAVAGAIGFIGWLSSETSDVTTVLPPILALAIALSSGVLNLLTRSSRIDDRRLHLIGLGWIVLMAALGSLAHALREAHLHDHVGAFGPGILVIAIFPLGLPSPPRHTAIVAGICAVVVPAVEFSVAAAGIVEIQPRDAVDIIGIAIGAALLAYVSSRMIFKLQRDAATARTLGAYELDEKLGEGGMGEVWTARHQLIKRRAAIKLVRPEELAAEGSTEAMERFYREALATSALESPHTVRLFDFGITDEGALYYVMELLDGVDLLFLVNRFGPQSASRTVQILRQVCDSLAEAHDAGLVHRDIKPGNIMICRQGRQVDYVKVLDFGVVSLQPEHLPDGSDQLTQAGAMVGTPAFMAPEAIRGGKVDARADLYSLGCVAYWLLTGEKVFRHSTVVAMAAAHMHDEPEAPSARGVQVPPALEELVMSLLAKNPLKRPQGADEVLEVLESCDPSGDWTQARARLWWNTHGPEKLSTSAPLHAVRRSIEAGASGERPAGKGRPRPALGTDATLDRTGGESMAGEELDVTRMD